MKKLRLGLIAQQMHNSVSPIVYAAYGEDLGLQVSYQICNVEPSKLEEQLNIARSSLHGFNVTMPYKQRVLEYVDEVDESAQKCASANVILVQEGKLIAFNTDGWGLMKAFALEGIQVQGKRVAMLGAGGVGLSIACSLSINEVKQVTVLNIDLPQAQTLCNRFGPRFTPVQLCAESLESSCVGADIFINASVIGQVGFEDFTSSDFLAALNSGAVVYDVNYSNPQAKLPVAAKAAGFQSYVGRSMTACQGIRAMQIWTGQTPSDQAARTLIQRLERQNR